MPPRIRPAGQRDRIKKEGKQKLKIVKPIKSLIGNQQLSAKKSDFLPI